MEDQTKVMLGMSCFKASHAQASATAEAFAKTLCEDDRLVLGVETDGLSRDSAEMRKFVQNRLAEPWSDGRVYLWDELTDRHFFEHWPSDCPMPFYGGSQVFSYGGAVNRILALAAFAGCQYLVRVDPGTAPPYYFREMIREHINAIDASRADVVSGQYTDRIALRDDFVPREKRAQYYEFVQCYTGIDPHRQVTGGAAFTMNVAVGPVPIPFPGFTPVWASDDGVYATICGSKALVLSESRVLRTDPGAAARHGKEYPVRLASMVVLRQLLAGSTESDAMSAGGEFLEELKSRGFYQQFIAHEAKVELCSRTLNIAAGVKNYGKLRERWPELVPALARVAGEHCDCYRDA